MLDNDDGRLPFDGTAEPVDGEGNTGVPRPDGGETFEDALGELQRIVDELESGELAIDAAVSLYEVGMRLVRLCTGHLDMAELRVSQITESIHGETRRAPFPMT